MAQHLLVEPDGHILRITIDRPEKRNALSRAVLNELADVFITHAAGVEWKAAILTGAGDKSFAAGGDLRDLAQVRSKEQATAMSQEARRALDAVSQFPVPVIAALNGDAIGGGAELAVACDFILAPPTSRIGFIQGKLNITTAWGGGIRLLNRLSAPVALRLMARSELLDAHAAQRIGLIDRVAEEGQTLEQCVAHFIEPMLAQAPQVLRGFKALALGHAQGVSNTELAAIETHHLVATWTHNDHWKAADKILNTRKTP